MDRLVKVVEKGMFFNSYKSFNVLCNTFNFHDWSLHFFVTFISFPEFQFQLSKAYSIHKE